MILIVGGAGYIGSQVNKLLSQKGYETVVFDNLVKGHREVVKWGKLEVGDLASIDDIEAVFHKYKFEAVLNFAAYIEVGESVRDPEKYYFNNLVNALNLLSVMRKHAVNKIIFSSTAATFGTPKYTPIDEEHPQEPINPYGKTKLKIESIFRDYEVAYGLKYVAFRYFNACGADKDGEIGEWHEPESHLIPILLQAAKGTRPFVQIFGDDYPTADGTCVRDYVHVEDLAQAHYLALKRLLEGGESGFYNLGGGKGHSNRDLVEAVKMVTGVDFEVRYAPRREGDTPILLASYEKAKKELGWEPKYKDIQEIIRTAWEWEKKKE